METLFSVVTCSVTHIWISVKDNIKQNNKTRGETEHKETGKWGKNKWTNFFFFLDNQIRMSSCVFITRSSWNTTQPPALDKTTHVHCITERNDLFLSLYKLLNKLLWTVKGYNGWFHCLIWFADIKRHFKHKYLSFLFNNLRKKKHLSIGAHYNSTLPSFSTRPPLQVMNKIK